MKAFEITESVKTSVKSIDPGAKVFLFGSRARGDSNSFSDWDFLILTSLSVDENLKRKIRSKLIETELVAEEVISSIIYSQEQWENYIYTPLYLNISHEGIEL
jgi:uncharacterized protein